MEVVGPLDVVPCSALVVDVSQVVREVFVSVVATGVVVEVVCSVMLVVVVVGCVVSVPVVVWIAEDVAGGDAVVVSVCFGDIAAGVVCSGLVVVSSPLVVDDWNVVHGVDDSAATIAVVVADGCVVAFSAVVTAAVLVVSPSSCS